VLPLMTNPPTRTSPPSSLAIATPSAAGANASSSRASRASKTLRAPAGPGAFPPEERLSVITLASSKTAEHDSPNSSWVLDELAATLVNQQAGREHFLRHLQEKTHQAHQDDLRERASMSPLPLSREDRVQPLSRSTIQRILSQADLKPHKSVYWLNSHDPDFDAKARSICRLYLDAPRLFQEEGRLVLSSDEKTSMQILGRPYPTQPAQPGKPEKREADYERHGTRVLMTTFCVPTGKVVWDLGQTRTSIDWADHLKHVVGQLPDMRQYHWVVDNLNTHWSLEVCLLVAMWCGIKVSGKELKTGAQRRDFLSDPDHEHVFHFTPKHGSWLNQVELFFSVLERKFLKRGDFDGAAEFEERIERWLQWYNQEHAHPYRWTYTGEPLVRGTPFSQTRRQRRQGRAWFGTRPPLFERLIHPPRPYHRRPKPLATDL
jgi:transposase